MVERDWEREGGKRGFQRLCVSVCGVCGEEGMRVCACVDAG